MARAPAEPLLTLAEVADLFGVTGKTVRRWVRDGVLPASYTAVTKRVYKRAAARWHPYEWSWVDHPYRMLTFDESAVRARYRQMVEPGSP